MKKVLAIFVAALFLFGTSSFRLNKHYCCGFLQSADFLITGNSQDCGMPQASLQNTYNHNNPEFTHNCCKNTTQIIEVSGKYQISHYSIAFHVPLLATLLSNFDATLNCAQHFNKILFHPPDPPKIAIHKLVSVFLI